MLRKFSLLSLVFLFLLAMANTADAQMLVCNRGLPTANLNNAAGALRSNEAWSFGNPWITGDDCNFGVAGETWIVTKIVGWSVQGAPNDTELGTIFKNDNVPLRG